MLQTVGVSTSDVHEPAANTAAVITYTADAARQHVVSGLAWSYSGAPTGGSLKIEDGAGNTVFAVGVTAAGPGTILFPIPKAGTVNRALVVTLAAGGAGVTGKVSVLNHWLQ
jgi:hypothetical protein